MIALRSLALVLGTVILAACGRESDRPITLENPTNSAIVQNEPRLLPPTSRTNAGSRAYARTNESGALATNLASQPDAPPPGEDFPDDADRLITRRIRTAILENDQFSESARDIEIFTFKKRVVLHGNVKSQQEKDAIASIVDQAGVTLLDNHLELDSSANDPTNQPSRSE